MKSLKNSIRKIQDIRVDRVENSQESLIRKLRLKR